MRAVIVLVLVASVYAQPAPTTTPKPHLLDVLKNVFNTFLHSAENYVQQLGTSLLTNTLPQLEGDLLAQGVTSLLHATGKRDAAEDIEAGMRVMSMILDANEKTRNLVQGIENLVNNFLSGKVEMSLYLELVSTLKTDYNNIIHGVTSGVLKEVSKALTGNKRNLSDLLGTFVGMLGNLEAQGSQLFGQLEQVLTTFANPDNVVNLLGSLAGTLLHH